MGKKSTSGQHPGPELNLGGKASDAAEVPQSVADLHCFTETSGVITTTMYDIPGYKVVRVLGTVYGLTVRSRNWAAGLGMVTKSIVGGELPWFTSLVSTNPSPHSSLLVVAQDE